MVAFFDVGQGDAVFIETPADHRILIDGGPTSLILEKIGKEMPFYDRTIDLIILTHPEKDHITGLLDVLKRYKIENILWTGVVRDTAEWREWSSLIAKEGAEINLAKAGQKIILQENPAIFIDIIHPSGNLAGQLIKDSNNTSIVSKLVFGGNSFLFTGDIEKEAENRIISDNIDADVLKVAHHGSKTSTSEEFLKKVSPVVAVIEVGNNNYGHPASEVLRRLADFGIRILITKENGDIIVTSDGHSLTY